MADVTKTSVSDCFRAGYSKSSLSDVFGISRPTLYKYIEMFNEGNTDEIPFKIKSFFKYVKESERTKEEMENFIQLQSALSSDDDSPNTTDLQWTDGSIEHCIINNDNALYIIFKNPAIVTKIKVRIMVRVSYDEIVLGEYSPDPEKQYIRIMDIPRRTKLYYQITDGDSETVYKQFVLR